MKKILIITAIISTIASISMSCRKGPNDPFLSLRSRDTRLIGIWKLSNITIDSTVTKKSTLNPIETDYTTKVFYVDSIKKTAKGIENTIDSVYYETLVINEDGTYSDTIKSRKVTMTKFNKRVVYNNWFWLDEKKNKEGIMLIGFGTFSVDRLAWKEIVLKSTKQTIRENQSGETTITVTKELKYKRQ